MVNRGEQPAKIVNRYEVHVLRKDGQIVNMIDSDNYDEAFQCWDALSTSWEESVKNTKPFRLKAGGVITCFDPGLISEIRMVTVEIESSRAYSLYNQDMSPTQFAKTFSKNLKKVEPVEEEDSLLDGGYK